MIRLGVALTQQADDDDHRLDRDGSLCEQAHLIEAYVGRELRVRTQTQFELHLFSCEHCLHAVEFELLVKRAIADYAGFARFSRSWH